VRMPDGSGRELYRDAVAHDGGLAARFVFITGDTANPGAWEFLKGTDTPVLEKPFSTDVFLDAVRRTASRESH
jgi:FixJ family two-component response regulator